MPKLSELGDVEASFDPRPGLHYKLSCYVCGPGCTKPNPVGGWMTFERIFQLRPDKCRFAVARKVPLIAKGVTVTSGPSPTGPWLCWDLWAEVLTDMRNLQRDGRILRAPDPIWTSDSEDGLIMKALALYERTPPT